MASSRAKPACCCHNEDVYVDFDGPIINFELSCFWQLFCTVGYGVCVVTPLTVFNECFSNFADILGTYIRSTCGFRIELE